MVEIRRWENQCRKQHRQQHQQRGFPVKPTILETPQVGQPCRSAHNRKVRDAQQRHQSTGMTVEQTAGEVYVSWH